MKIRKKRIAIISKLPPPMGGVAIHCERLFFKLNIDPTFDVEFYSLVKVKDCNLKYKYVKFFLVWIFKKIIFGFKTDIVHYQLSNYYGLIMVWVLCKIRKNLRLAFSIHSLGIINNLQNKYFLKKIIIHILNDVDCLILGAGHLEPALRENNVTREVVVLDAFLLPHKKQRKKLPTYVKDLINLEGKTIVANAYNINKIAENKDLYGLHILASLAKKLNKNNVKFKMLVLISVINDNDQEYVNNTVKDIENIYVINDSKIQGWNLISQADVMIRPTSTDVNAFSLKEAMMFNVFAIASDVVPRYNDVITFKYPDVKDLYKKVIETFSSTKNNYVVLDNIEKYIEMYKSIK